MLDLVGREAASRFVAAQARWLVFSGQLSDTLETDNLTSIRACTHGAHTNIRNQIGIYLWDDFEFYRGLLGDLVAWSAASHQVPGRVNDSSTGPYRKLELFNSGSSMLRWALDIRPGEKWLESKIERLAQSEGFRLLIWNRLPKAQPAVTIRSDQVGLAPGTDVLQVQMLQPAYRRPAEIEVLPEAEKLVVKVNTPASIRLCYEPLRPGWKGKTKPVLESLQPDGRLHFVTQGIVWDSGCAKWQAGEGQYEMRRIEP